MFRRSSSIWSSFRKSSGHAPPYWMLIGVALLAAAPATSTLGATAEVTKSGKTYTVILDGMQIYSGVNFADALNAASGGTEGGQTVNIRAGGTIRNTVRLRRMSTYNYFPSSERIVMNVNGPGLYGYKASNIVLNGFRIGGSPTYGIRLSSCHNCTVNNIDMDFGGAQVAVALRVDNEGIAPQRVNGFTVRNARVANIQANGDRQAIETYAVDGYDIDGVDAYNLAGCGVLINDGENGRIGSVYAELCGNGTTYAGLRFANGCSGASVDYCEAYNCARGLFILDSENIRVSNVDIRYCGTDTIFIQRGGNNKVMSGIVVDPDDPPVIVDSPGSSINVDYFTE